MQEIPVMNPYCRYILSVWIGLSLLACFCSVNTVRAEDFIVVIDPGHGGRDPGAVGKISKEKNINLKVALKLGNLIKENCKDVKVVYTRTTDVFLALDKRAEIANKAKADLFISVHTNAVPRSKTVKGASTWTLGLARSDENLEVAKRENAVILLENDYESRYAGFNPNSSESYIIFEFMQDKYMEQSVHLASLVQKEFKSTCKREDRGVHQAGFLVLRATAMPSILVELGFISTPEEEKYLNTEAGTTNLARGIYNAFVAYRGESKTPLLPRQPVRQTTPGRSNPRTETATRAEMQKQTGVVFKVQFLSSGKLLKKGDKQFKGLKNVSHYKDGNVYKYTYGESADYNKILKLRRTVAKDFKDAFVVAFKDGKRTDLNQAIKEFNNR